MKLLKKIYKKLNFKTEIIWKKFRKNSDLKSKLF